MSYTVPPNNVISLLVENDAKRRSLYEQDQKLKARDWTNTDPGRGPVRGWGGGQGHTGRTGRGLVR